MMMVSRGSSGHLAMPCLRSNEQRTQLKPSGPLLSVCRQRKENGRQTDVVTREDICICEARKLRDG
jgi:hypothetical protein